ncbi:MAG: sterol desaturase/sphingolipid hydroxylase (fatty acid hydroxylase superfamily) [Hyphomicrobiaceae bacterium]|jgi:sterol desaturase/sphingolipid hydroxylase (fatty acid hydroxylase superfamily)
MLAGWRRPRAGFLQNPIVWTIALVFVTDGMFYVYHRLQHAIPLFWHIHKLHHTDPDMNITTSSRTHFLEKPLQFICFGAPALWIVGMNWEGVALASVIGPFFLYFAHLDVPLSLGPLTPIIIGPDYHRIHHSKAAEHHNSNFAQAFPLFDMLGGTYRRPQGGERVETGLAQCETAAERWRPIFW